MACSCNRTEPPIAGNAIFSFYLRNCDALTVYNYYRYNLFDNQAERNEEEFYLVDNLKGTGVRFEDYILNVVLSDSHPKSSNIPFAKGETKHDLDLEHLIKDHFFTDCIQIFTKSSSASAPAGLVFYDIEYRNEVITDIVVSCKDDLFGRKAGSSLNDYIETYGTPIYHNFMISSDGVFLGGLKRGLTISEYLNFSPLAAASLYLHFVETPANVPAKTQFIIKVTMSDGRLLQYTTAEIEFPDV